MNWFLSLVSSKSDLSSSAAFLEGPIKKTGIRSCLPLNEEIGHSLVFHSFRLMSVDSHSIEKLRQFLASGKNSFLLAQKPIPLNATGAAAFFDADMTLFQAEVIDLLGELAGKKTEMEDITRKAMEGAMDFDKSIALRMGMLRELDCRLLGEAVSKIPLTRGAAELLRLLKKSGWKISVISGGFSAIIERVLVQNNIAPHQIHAHELDAEQGKLTGKIRGRIVNRKHKREITRDITVAENIDPLNTIACGDGYNDGEMLKEVSCGFGFMPKKKLGESLFAAVKQPDLRIIAVLMGWKELSWLE